jgi:hypothetical protein
MSTFSGIPKGTKMSDGMNMNSGDDDTTIR